MDYKFFYSKGDGRIKRIWNIVVSVLLAATCILVFAFIGPGFFGIRTYVVTSGSMEPMYPVGSMIYVKTVLPEEVQVGDAITFYMKGSDIVATHQVYEIDEANKQFRTQGINNKDSDGNIIHDASPVGYSSLIGKPIVCIPYMGYVNRFCTTPPGLYAVIGAAVAVLLVSFAVDRLPEKESPKRKM